MADSLETSIIRKALFGFSKVECPGGFIAYIAKPEGRAAIVRYVHCNTAEVIHRMTHKQVRRYLLNIN